MGRKGLASRSPLPEGFDWFTLTAQVPFGVGEAILRLSELSQRELTQRGPYEGIFMYEGFIWDLGDSFQVESLQIMGESLEVDRVSSGGCRG